MWQPQILEQAQHAITAKVVSTHFSLQQTHICEQAGRRVLPCANILGMPQTANAPVVRHAFGYMLCR
jgi:hypothetical protein